MKAEKELQNGILYTAFEEQWESNLALKVDKLVTSILRKWPLNVLVLLLESSPLSTSIQHYSHPLKPAPPISLTSYSYPPTFFNFRLKTYPNLTAQAQNQGYAYS